MVAGRHIAIRGTVQGVGFRPWVYRVARGLGVRGCVLNDASGVVIEAFASAETLARFEAVLRRDPPPAARIVSFESRAIDGDGPQEFVIAPSRRSEERRVSIPPDLATCPECERELFDAKDRRFHYPFINCTNCGPRFTIAQGAPYDRPLTTMAPFVLCAECAREYRDPADRRFHAQPNACPVCGPRLRATRGDGLTLSGDPIALAAEALAGGGIVAVKGLGGFHLSCDATDAAAVRLLRTRKHREERAFAVMVRTLEEARALADLAPEEARLLGSVERPITLVQRRSGARLAPEVAPGNPRVGLMLAYSPLHHLLLHGVGRPLVMTSGNLSDEPIALRNEEALARLQGLADLFLLHDREVETRCDDSVAQLVAGAPMVLRRSRGYVPRGIPLDHQVKASVLAVGADLKNAICVAAGDTAWLGPHVGDLGSPETWRSLEEGTGKLLRFLQVTPARIACDQHPDSIAASFARQLATRLGLPAPVRVQHHHAHVASAIAEHGLDGKVIGVAFDGTGWGPDGTLWGGEVLLADYTGYQRLATLRPIPLPGGETAIRQTWRVALAALDDAFEGRTPVERLPLFAQVPRQEIAVARRLVEQGFNAPLARGVGRVFDAAGAIALGRPRASYEGQVALDWNLASGPAGVRRYPFVIDGARAPRELDLRPLWRALCEDVLAGVPAARISAAFHDTLIEATAALVRGAAEQCGALPVVLTGGCFANARLAEGLALALTGFEVHLHRQVPPGDGGLALGQALVANASPA